MKKNKIIVELLDKTGLTQVYEKWNEELTGNGFVIDDIEESLIKHKTLTYYYSGHFAVQGDHADDVFGLSAILSEKGVVIAYCSSKLSIKYLGCRDAKVSVINTERLSKVKSFLNKFRNYTGDHYECVEIDSVGCFQMFLTEHYEISHAVDTLIKLAVLLDKELQKRYPFEGIRDYEEHNRIILSETVEDFESFKPSGRRGCRYNGIRHNECLQYDNLLDIIIMSSYTATQDETLEKFYNMANALMKCIEKQQFTDAERIGECSSCTCASQIEKTFYNEKEILSLVDRIKRMSTEEYEEYKDRLFDL